MKPKAAVQFVQHKKPQQMGKWIYQPLRSKIAVCSCGNKFVVTGKDQVLCFFCSRK